MENANDESPPDVLDMIGDSVGPRGGAENTAVDDLHIRITIDDEEEAAQVPQQSMRVYTGEVRNAEPTERRARGAGRAPVKKKADLVKENAQLANELAALKSKGASAESRGEIGMLAAMVAVALYGMPAHYFDKPHIALTEDETRAIDKAFATGVPDHHIAQLQAAMPYLIPATAMLTPLMRITAHELKLRKDAQRMRDTKND